MRASSYLRGACAELEPECVDEAHQLAEDGVRFALEREDLTVEHYVPAGVAVAA
jgi:hypothetical protein